MGLDITAYPKVYSVVLPKGYDDPAYNGDVHFRLYPAFEEVAERMGPLVEGWYERKSWEDTFEFRAGSYSGYGRWREWLADFAGTKTKSVWAGEKAPFWELINFSDCEGAIGPECSARLALEFAGRYAQAIEWAGKAIEGEPERAYFLHTYRCFMAAFALASDGGAVRFH